MATLLQPPWEVRAEQACGVKPAAPLWPPGSGEQNTKLSIPEDLFWTPAESPGSPTHGHTSFRSRPAAPGGWRDPVSAAPPATGHTDPAAPGGWRMRPCVRSLRLPPLQGTQTRDLGQPVLSESPPQSSVVPRRGQAPLLQASWYLTSVHRGPAEEPHPAPPALPPLPASRPERAPSTLAPAQGARMKDERWANTCRKRTPIAAEASSRRLWGMPLGRTPGLRMSLAMTASSLDHAESVRPCRRGPSTDLAPKG
ncbi:uncharacterized protein [Macaca nemestrina]|uniref:uncharacterized protein n=1 Tax=Macaca nemestrina TaxID=9545 RepID=UPI0039B96F84